MKRTKAAVPATETGKVPGDYSGSRQFTNMPTKGGRNATTNEARRGAGVVAPRPQNSKSQYMAASSATAPTTASMARVTDSPMGDSALRLPVSHPKANITSKQFGQAEKDPGGPGLSVSPQTKTPVTRNPVASGKPRRKGLGSSFYGEY